MAKQQVPELNKELDAIAKQFIRFPKEIQELEHLPYGYILKINGKRYKIEAKEILK